MVTRKIDLQIRPGGKRHRFRIKQYETGDKALLIRLTDDGAPCILPAGTPAELCFSRPDGSGFSILCSVDGELLSADVTSDMTECPGKVVCAVLFPLEGEWLCTDEFTVSIMKKEVPDNADTTDSA